MNKLQWEPSVDLLHWSLGVKLEIPRATKHNLFRWIFKVRVLCFGLALKRVNDTRVPKTQPTAV